MSRPIRLALSLALLACALVRTAGAADLDEVRARGVLRHLGVPYANFVSGAGDGMDVELVQAFAASLGVRYEYVPTDWGTVVPDLVGRQVQVAGGRARLGDPAPVKGDLIANGFTVLPWRQEVVAFSQPTFPSQIWLVARADSPVQPIAPTGRIEGDIAATRALMKGRSVLTVARTCLDPQLYDFGAAGARAVTFTGNLNDVAPALLGGEADLTILDVPDALVALAKWRGKLKILGPITGEQRMAVAFPRDAPALAQAYDAFLARARQDGTYLRLVKKYYPTAASYFPEFFAGAR
jgi:ABC-type amino acid transport substrate-binding protein